MSRFNNATRINFIVSIKRSYIAENGFDHLCGLGHDRSNLIIIKIREGPFIMHRGETTRVFNSAHLIRYTRKGMT